jgi:hypothetical protein
MKKFLKRLVDFLFGEYLKELKEINKNLTIIRLLMIAEKQPTVSKQYHEMITALGPLKPLSGDKPTIFIGA